MDIEERQAIAAVATFVGLMLAVPVVVLAALAFVAGWLWLLGVPGGHGMLFGWLSTKHYNHTGHPVWGISRLVPVYFFGVLSAYLAYQVTELLNGSFRAFQRALA